MIAYKLGKTHIIAYNCGSKMGSAAFPPYLLTLF